MAKTTGSYTLQKDRQRSILERHRSFLEATLQIPSSDMIVLEGTFHFQDFFLRHYLPGVPLSSPSIPSSQADKVIKAWKSDYETSLPILESRLVFSTERSASGPIQWETVWGDNPVAIWFHNVSGPVVFLRLRVEDFGKDHSVHTSDLLIAGRSWVAPALEIIARLDMAAMDGEKSIYLPNGFDQSFVPNTDWDSVVLDASLSRLVRSDFQTFLERKQWFETNRIPYRRGYLLHGPPGNGKTSVLRLMASDPRVSVTTMFWEESLAAGDRGLILMFKWAAENAPTIVILEDIDRHFPKDSSSHQTHRISTAHLLNCLDGIATASGVIVVATANDPAQLDGAILRRPGRFDRVVEFKNPSAELRSTYIEKHCIGPCAPDILCQIVQKSAGFSFAQLREAYVLAGNLAYDRGGDVMAEDMVAALDVLNSTNTLNYAFGRNKSTPGFGVSGSCS
jgi:hypothetical protein